MAKDYFGEQVAERYDESSAEMFEPAVVDFLAGLAGHGPALELGIGTGRIALPLARRGIRVHGIDLSEAMVARLRAEPGAERMAVTIGDFATTTVDGRFSLAYLVFNTIMNLTSQEEQVACFQNVAAHLEPDGCFVIEVMVPALQRLPPGETVRAFNVSATRLGFDEYDVVSQGLISHDYSVVDGRLDVDSMPFRYVWPSELDLMARLAGMRLRERWSGWRREPFTSDSSKHTSLSGRRRLRVPAGSNVAASSSSRIQAADRQVWHAPDGGRIHDTGGWPPSLSRDRVRQPTELDQPQINGLGLATSLESSQLLSGNAIGRCRWRATLTG
jgi:SAM-dependent methyltransferase